MADTAIDYGALLEQYGGTASDEPPQQKDPDYAGLLQQFGGRASDEAPVQPKPKEIDYAGLLKQFGGRAGDEPPKSGAPSVRGMEQLGALPGGPRVALPPGIIEQPLSSGAFQNPRTGRTSPGAPLGTGPLGILDAPVLGAQKIIRGTEQVAAPVQAFTKDVGRSQLQAMGQPQPGRPALTPQLGREFASGGSKILGGAMQAATPLIPGSLASAPFRTLATVAAAMAADKATSTALKAAGASPEWAEFGGAVAGVLAAGKGAHSLYDKVYRAAGSPTVEFGKIETPKEFADMTDDELLAHANKIAREQPPNAEWQREQIAKEVLKRQAGRGMGAGEAPPAADTVPTPQTEQPTPQPVTGTQPTAITVEPGNTYETPIGKAEVTAFDGKTVTFDHTLHDGTVIQGSKRPLALFQKSILPPKPAEPEETATQTAEPVTQTAEPTPAAVASAEGAPAPPAPSAAAPVEEQPSPPPGSPGEPAALQAPVLHFQELQGMDGAQWVAQDAFEDGGGYHSTVFQQRGRGTWGWTYTQADESGQPLVHEEGTAETREAAQHEAQAVISSHYGEEPPAPAPVAAPASTPTGSPSEPAQNPDQQSVAEKPQAAPQYEPNKYYNIPPSQLTLDPARFQFKQEGVGQKGVTDQFKNVRKWDPNQAGTVSAWLDPADGKVYPVNGFHRTELGQRLGDDKVPEGIHVRMIDAPNATRARATGALINIGEGNGTPLDIAKFLRDSGLTRQQIESEGAIVFDKKNAQQGAAMANLAQPIFEDVVAGALPVERAAIIGNGLPNHADQKVLYAVLAKAAKAGRRPTNDQVEEMIRLANGGAKKVAAESSQANLFGDEQQVEQSLLGEKAEISDYVRKQLIAEKRLFGIVGNQGAAERLGVAGNVIKAGENAQVAERASQGLHIYDKLSESAGPVNTALEQAAVELAKGGDVNAIKQRAYQDIRAHVIARADQLAGVGPPDGRPVEAGGAGRSSEAGGGESSASLQARELKPGDAFRGATRRGGGKLDSLPGRPGPGRGGGSSEGSGPDISGYRPPQRPIQSGISRDSINDADTIGPIRPEDSKGYGSDLEGRRPDSSAPGNETPDSLLSRAPGSGNRHQDLTSQIPESLFTPEEEAASKIAAKSAGDKLLGDQLTAQIKSGMAARPAKLKPAKNRSLFEDEGPEQGGLFSRAIPGFYSQLERVIGDKMKGPADPLQLLAMLKNPQSGIKSDELHWTGIDTWLSDQKGQPVTKQQVQDFLKQNEVRVEEVGHGNNDPAIRELTNRANDALHVPRNQRTPEQVRAIEDLHENEKQLGEKPTKFGSYVTPGGENYRELLLTLPEHKPYINNYGRWLESEGLPKTDETYKQWLKLGDTNQSTNYRSPHWEEPNVLAHIRFDDRTGPGGEKILHLSEIQSDWHQEGKKKGYAKDTKGWTAHLLSAPDAGFTHWQISDADRNYVTKIVGGTAESAIRKAAEGIPAAPFAKTWHELAFRRALRYAVEHGYSALTWDNGTTQAERYDLSKHIDSLKVLEGNFEESGGPGYEVTAKKDGQQVIHKRVKQSELPDLIGKDMADKALAAIEENKKRPVPKYAAEFHGLDLKTPAPGMVGFYDKILPEYANKLGKRWGAKVGTTEIASPLQKGNQPDSLSDDQIFQIRTLLKKEDYLGFDNAGLAMQAVRGHPDWESRWEIESPELKQALREYYRAMNPPVQVHSLPITPAMRASVMQGQSLFARKPDPNQLELFHERATTPEDLARPAQRTTAFQANLKNIPAVRNAPKPAGPTATLKEIQAYWEGAAVKTGLLGGRPALFVNNSAMEVILRRMGATGVGESATHTLGLTMKSGEWQNLLDEAKVAGKHPRDGGFDAALVRIARSIRSLMETAHSAPLIVMQTGESMEGAAIQRIAEEEYDHFSQMLLPGGLRGLPVVIVETPAGQKAAAALAGIGYPKVNPASPFYEHNRAIIAAEIGVRLMRAGRWQELNVTAQEAGDLAQAYVDGLAKHGDRATAIIDQVHDAILQGKTAPARRRGGSPSDHASVGPGGAEGPRGPPERTGPDVSGLEANNPTQRVGAGEAAPQDPNASLPVFHARPREPLVRPPRPGETASTITLQSRKPKEEEPGAIRTFLSSETGTSDVGPLKRIFRDEVNYSGIGAIGNVFNRNLSQTSKAAPLVDAALIKLASFQARAAAVLHAATGRMEHALKDSGVSLAEVFQAFTESRLRGARIRWDQMSTKAVDDADLDILKDLPHYLDLLDAIEGRSGMPGDLSQTATRLAENTDKGPLREFLADTFQGARDRVTRVMPPDQFGATVANPGYQEAKRIYKSTAEKEMARTHAEHEGIFSTALGPEETYYPLMPAIKHAGSGIAMPYVKPKNMANAFATGLSPEYDWSIERFRKWLSSAFHSGDKFAALNVMEQTGWLQPEARGGAPRYVNAEGEEKPGVPAFTLENGRMLPGKSVIIAKERSILQNGKFTRVPARTGVMPLFMYQEAEPILEGKGYDDPTNLVSRIIHGINGVAVAGLAEPIYHGRNVAGGVISNLPFIAKAIGDIKIAKLKGDLSKAEQAFSLNPKPEEFASDLIEMSKLGMVPDRFGRMAYDARTAELMGGKQVRVSLAPLLFGTKGLDIKARWLMYRTIRYLNPEATPREMHDFVNQLGTYTYGLQGRIERFVKHVGIGPFYTAGSTGIRRGIKVWSGVGPNAIPGARGVLLHQLFMGGVTATIAWAIVYHAMTGKWPAPFGRDKAARLGYLPAPASVRHSALGNALWGRGPEIGEINMFAWHPDYGRGARLFGIPRAMQTASLGGSAEQILEGGMTDTLNTILQPAMGPAPRAGIAFGFGVESALTGMRDDRGHMQPQAFRAVPKKTGGFASTSKWRASAAIKEMNGFYHNVGVATGLFPANPDEKGSHVIRGIAGLAAPGLVGPAYNPNAAATFLRQQRQAMGDR